MFQVLKDSFSDCPSGTGIVLFYSKCHLRCGYCYNWPLITGKVTEGLIDCKEAIELIQSQQLDGPNGQFLKNEWLILSGGEPLMMEKTCLVSIIKEAKKIGMKIGMWTSLTYVIDEEIQDFLLKNLDFINIDYKTSSDNYFKVAASMEGIRQLKDLSYLFIQRGRTIVQFSTVLTPKLITEHDFEKMVKKILILKNIRPLTWRLVKPIVPEEGLLNSEYEDRLVLPFDIKYLIPAELKGLIKYENFD